MGLLPDHARCSSVYEELHTQRKTALHPAAKSHGASVAGRSSTGLVSVLLLSVHSGDWLTEEDRGAGDHTVSVFEGTEHLRLRAAGCVRRRRSECWARPQ